MVLFTQLAGTTEPDVVEEGGAFCTGELWTGVVDVLEVLLLASSCVPLAVAGDAIEFSDGEAPEEPESELPAQLPVGFPQPFPPATGHHMGSGWLGSQSAIGGEI